MLKKGNYTSIYIDFKLNCVHVYSFSNRHIVHDTRNINEKLFSKEYYVKFTEALKDLTSRLAPAPASNTTIIFPDSVVFQDSVTFPTIKSKDVSKPLEIYNNNTYKNLKNLEIKTNKIITNKQYTTILLTGILSDVISNIKVACNNARIIPGNFTFASNATICALNDLSEKYSNQSYMFLDIKENSSKYITVYKGLSIASFDLPIGYSSLKGKDVAAEDVLLYAPRAELLVLNAKEKAKQKALTLSGNENEDLKEDDNIDIDLPSEEDEENAFAGFDSLSISRKTETVVKSLPKKVARKLPKFMAREIPSDDESKSYESFRIFIKWALDLINNSNTISSFAKPSTVYVNLPKEFNFVFDKANVEVDNGVKFVPAALYKEKEDIYSNLEMYGGLIANSSKKTTML